MRGLVHYPGDGDELVRGNLQGVDPVIHTAATSHLSCHGANQSSTRFGRKAKWDPGRGGGLLFTLSGVPSVWKHNGNEGTVRTLKSWYRRHWMVRRVFAAFCITPAPIRYGSREHHFLNNVGHLFIFLVSRAMSQV